MFTVKKIKNFEDLAEIVEKMKKRSENDATKRMIEDFEEEKEKCEYFLAEDNERYGLMSVCAPPKIKSEEKSNRLDDRIDKSVWVEGLVADAKSGLGSILLIAADFYAISKEKPYVSLAAYEYDQEPQTNQKYKISKPYSIAAYYAEKQGFVFTGEGYLERKGDKDLVYPIYCKSVEKTRQILQCIFQLKDDFKFIKSKL